MRHKPPSPRPLGVKPITLPVSPREAAHAAAMIAIQAAHAIQRRDVEQFRATILHDRRLTDAEAERFVASPILRVVDLPTAHLLCARWSIPLIGHVATLTGERRERTPKSRSARRILDLVVDGNARTLMVPTRADEPDIDVRYVPAASDGDDLVVRRYPARPDSVVDRLRIVAEALADEYGWEVGEAARFVLTHALPMASPITGEARHWPTTPPRKDIVLTLAPWVSEATLVQAFRHAQRKLSGSQARSRVSDRNLRIYSFVNERTAGLGWRPPFSQLLAEWNEICPDGEQGDTPRHFSRDFHRGRVAIEGKVV
jgi:hypothetical protein